MAQYQDPNDPNNQDWWSQNAPPPSYAPGQYPMPPGGTPNPTGGGWGGYPTPNGQAPPSVPQVAPPGMHWDPTAGTYVPDVAPTPQDPGPGGPPPVTTQPIGVPTSGFGAAPTPYVSNPNAPEYTPLPTYTAPTWTGGDFTNPTEADLQAMPGYQSQLDAGLQARSRSAAAQGTVLNGGTLKALTQYGTDYANQSYQTLRNNTLDAYKQRYAQFQDAAGMDLNARTINANQNQNTFQNNTNSYLTGNSRTLSDYITNLNAQRNNQQDYWSRLMDVSNSGANLAGGSYKA